ncbi:class I SAM-dependent rRNA methyltransferase [Lederbergia citrea]|uniref:Class I SAM-dependent rRNA methyltransferase n=1 Tax=Lederbergia citrea TaxID=2833581 RepID=A0A942UPC1_9BACI|nr:class I SAM-dependent rRNA methyltransferase [Lederbergia citrea]MBS4223552.1 class I SAM-dependent rRNA methyltransferase [Lederbergia citrea]
MSGKTIVKIKNKYRTDYKSGYPLITKEAILNVEVLKTEGEIIHIVDEQGQFLGKGYYGLQNKGYGWVLSFNKNEEIDQSFFEEKIAAAVSLRKQFYENTETTAFRVFNGAGDGIGGLTIDYFAGYYLVTWYSKGIYSFKDEVIHALEKTVSYKGIYEKKRFADTGQYVEDDDFVKGERGEFPMIVKENGVNFAIYLNDGAMTGVFLDQREVRKAIRDRYSDGKTVLNTFSYTGAFSVFAALGGAAKTTSVDLANRSKAKTIEQFSINDIDFEAQDIIVDDVFQYFKYAVRKQLAFDLVILDPPSFARSKKVTFSAAKDYKNLLKEAIAITENGGVIVASTNSNAFGMKKFKGFINSAFKESGTNYQILEEFSLPEDFRTSKDFKEGNYLKVVFIRKA